MGRPLTHECIYICLISGFSYILICELYSFILLIRAVKLTGFVFTIPVHQFDGVVDNSAGVD